MPPRRYVWAILVFWMGTSGWMFHRDFWPHWRTGDAPPYRIDLIDEALIRETPEIHWNVFRGKKRLGMLRTWVQYRANDDIFELHMSCVELDLYSLGRWRIRATDVESVYRVTRQGELKEIRGEGKITVPELGSAQGLGKGVIKEGRFIPTGYVVMGGFKQDLELEPVEVPQQANILNPLHPVNRIPGLQPGQHWQVPWVDLVDDTISAWLKKDPTLSFLQALLPKRTPGVHTLQAEVSRSTELLNWHNNEVECLVIDYQGDNISARIWVRASDGLVLRQDATMWGETLVLERDILKAIHPRSIVPKHEEPKVSESKQRTSRND